MKAKINIFGKMKCNVINTTIFLIHLIMVKITLGVLIHLTYG